MYFKMPAYRILVGIEGIEVGYWSQKKKGGSSTSNRWAQVWLMSLISIANWATSDMSICDMYMRTKSGSGGESINMHELKGTLQLKANIIVCVVKSCRIFWFW